ncbi:methyltransferase domain protein [Rhizoctonia solani]|uniref:Methyltransferase domain protein n=1 Tax=Rhizoctonia solani TaxID=456999 RepID=A0A8H8PBW0_9AGAM|nr:methyltransferase domain protein [Rhizoctonia solani]QRW27047.1 methyltransferase domain protein [Rhizoctonia solani]
MDGDAALSLDVGPPAALAVYDFLEYHAPQAPIAIPAHYSTCTSPFRLEHRERCRTQTTPTITHTAHTVPPPASRLRGPLGHRAPISSPRPFQTPAASYSRPASARHLPCEAGPHDLWMGARVSPRLGLRTPLPLAATGTRLHPTVPRPALNPRLLAPSGSSDSVSDSDPYPRAVSVNSSFVILDPSDPALPSAVAKRLLPCAEDHPEWALRNGRRHLRSQFTRGVKQARRERKEEASGTLSTPRPIPYPLDYSPETLANNALGHLLHSNYSSFSSIIQEQNEPRSCLDLGCGGGEWIRGALRQWPTCEFVGMDIVLLNRAQLSSQKGPASGRVTWVKGDFLADQLPFDNESFDRVHMRDLSHAIPYHAWSLLLSEIARVLQPGGTLDLTTEDIIFPILPRSLTARPTWTEIATFREAASGRNRDPSQDEERPGTMRLSDASIGPGGNETVRGKSDETVRNRQPTPTPPPFATELGSLLRMSDGTRASSRRGGSTTPSETMSRSRGESVSKPRSRSRDILRGTFSDGESTGVRAGIGRILRGPRRSAATSPTRGDSDTATARKSVAQPLFVSCVTAAGSSPILPPEPARASSDEPRSASASMGLGVPSFGFALSSAALGSALSLRSMDGSIHPGQASVLSLHPPPAGSNTHLAHSSVVSFQGPLSPPLTPPRRELTIEPTPLGHDYELLEDLYYAVYAKRDIHVQLTNSLPGLMESCGLFGNIDLGDPVTVDMPTYTNKSCRRDEAHTPPTPDMSPKSGNLSYPSTDRDHVSTSPQVCSPSVREAMWEELVLRRELGDSDDQHVRQERMRFEDMITSYAASIQALIDVPSKLTAGVQWRRPVPREQTPEQKWVAAESQKLRTAWAAREACQGLTGYSTCSRRIRTIIATKA